MFDWQTFFDRYGITYIVGGKAGRGNLGIVCPWCGNPNHMDHLGVGPNGYYCWKEGRQHSGRSPHRLVSALLGCSLQEASRIVGSGTTSFARDDDTFASDAFKRLGMVMSAAATPKFYGSTLEPLAEFSPICKGGWFSDTLAIPYLIRRGYNGDGALRLAEQYALMFAMSGAFAYRIVIPVVVNKHLVNWTARTVAAHEELRYKSLSTDSAKAAAQGLPVASLGIKDALFDYDRVVRGGEILVVTEGPFDAMRVGFFGERYGIKATALFGKQPSAAQIDLLAMVAPRYDEVVALFDRDADFDAFRVMPDYLKMHRLELPRGIKDPGELSSKQFHELFRV